MDHGTFSAIIKEQQKMCDDILVVKAAEYATEDRLHNFRVASTLQNCEMRQSLAGYMAKHTISIYDMCYSDKQYSMEMWEEKLTDHINYLLLLKAVVTEEASV